MKREALLAALDEELRFQMGGAPGAWIEPLTHAFAAIEARGLAVVPVVATPAMLRAADEAPARYVDMWDAMLTASKDPAHD